MRATAAAATNNEQKIRRHGDGMKVRCGCVIIGAAFLYRFVVRRYGVGRRCGVGRGLGGGEGLGVGVGVALGEAVGVGDGVGVGAPVKG